jgi:hypothetical protein
MRATSSACELAVGYFVLVKQDRKHPSVLTDSGVPTLTLLERLTQQWSGHAEWIEAMGTLLSDLDERALLHVQQHYSTVDRSTQLSRWASLQRCVAKNTAQPEKFCVSYCVYSAEDDLLPFQGEVLRNKASACDSVGCLPE